MGSLRESVLTLLVMKLETVEHARFRALAQITLNKDKGVEAFEEYMKIAFPYLESVKKHERLKHIEVLKREVERGPIAVHPQQQPQLRSRLAAARTRVRPKTPAEEQQLYRKLGRSL